jgi:Amt family ammonium transporter
MLMQTLTGLAIGSLLWFVIGFTLTFGPSQGGIIGNLDHIFLLDVGIECCFPLSTATTLPGILFAGFQMMFALMVPVIVTGAWAERMEFKAFAWFTFLWPILVYYPLAHWIWNSNGWLAKYGVLDFAGGLTIHSSTGVAALVVSSILAGRMKGHTTIGKVNDETLFVCNDLLMFFFFSLCFRAS